MKVSVMLFSLLVACQILPVTMHSAAAQSEGTINGEMAEMSRAVMSDQFGPARLRTEYANAVARSRNPTGKPLAVTYEMVVDTTMKLNDGNTFKSQVKTLYAYDKDGRTRSVSLLPGLERIIIADPMKQVVYLVCPERKEVLRMAGAALVSVPDTAPARQQPDAGASGVPVSLGEKEIAGVKAIGSKLELTVPAGAKGNDKPLVSKSETWFSVDLGNIVYFRTSSPEFGDIVMHVENLKFGDVPASTFALPEGFAIRDIAPANNEAK